VALRQLDNEDEGRQYDNLLSQSGDLMPAVTDMVTAMEATLGVCGITGALLDEVSASCDAQFAKDGLSALTVLPTSKNVRWWKASFCTAESFEMLDISVRVGTNQDALAAPHAAYPGVEDFTKLQLLAFVLREDFKRFLRNEIRKARQQDPSVDLSRDWSGVAEEWFVQHAE